MNKYRNRKTVVDGYTFQSKKEANCYGFIKLRLRAGEIKSFSLQETYLIRINDVNVCKYIADFVIVHHSGLKEVIDCKGFKTPVYNLKKKLMKAVHGIEITEV